MRNNNNNTVIINGGQIVVKIGTATFIIVVKPKLQREILINVLITTHTGYLIFLFVFVSVH